MTEAVAEAPVTTLAPVGGLAIEQQREAGINALARMTDAEFSNRLKSLSVGISRFMQMTREVLKVGNTHDADLRQIPGVDRPVLTLSGAEKLCFVARLAPSFEVTRTAGAPPDEPAIHYIVRCRLHLGNTEGPVIAEGVGSCSSHEKKYRWRVAEKYCPACGVVGSLILSKWEAKGGEFKGLKTWVCLTKRGGCGAEFHPEDSRAVEQKGGMIENSDPHDLDNTLLKMAKKRAYVDGTKTATASSGMVTADLDEGQPGTNERQEVLDGVYERARLLKWTTLGPIFAVVSAALGRTIRTKKELDALTANELADVLKGMPPAPDESAAPMDEAIAAGHEGDEGDPTYGD